MQQQGTQAVKPQENFFDEGGNDITAGALEAAPEEGTVEEATEETASSDEATAVEPQKYRIGDREFATQAEAIAFAQSHLTTLETEKQIASAYQAGIREALKAQPGATQTVTPETPAKPVFDTTKFYENPEAFLAEFAQQIKQETRTELEQTSQIQAESNRIWSEFTQRHPMLADFRSDVEDYVAKNLMTVQSVIATKGHPAAYDYVATQIKSRAAAIAAAAKPNRELPNGGTVTAPATKTTPNVTKKTEDKKGMSMAEQIRKIRSKG